MNPEEYKSIFELEATHWWYKGLHDLLFSTIEDITGKNRDLKILDAGCGTGYALKRLESYGIPSGVDISDIALSYCLKRGANRIFKASVSSLPFPDEFFDLVISMDVIYHQGISDDITAIGEMGRVLKRGGYLIINVPAHDYLRRSHDEAVNTRHRYTREELRDKLIDSGFDITKISYRNAVLFIALLLFKLTGFKSGKGSSDLKPIARPINSVLYSILKMENIILRYFDIPIGSSIFCVARKKELIK